MPLNKETKTEILVRLRLLLRRNKKMSEEFILKACKSFRMHVDTIIEKKFK